MQDLGQRVIRLVTERTSCEADMGPRPVVLPGRFNANARSNPCSGVAHLAAHDGTLAGEEAGPPCHLFVPGERWEPVTVRVGIGTGYPAEFVVSLGSPSDL